MIDHVAIELAPHDARGGLGVAVARLVEQLADAGVHSRVLTPAASLDVGEHRRPWGAVVALPCPGVGAERIATYTEQAVAALAPGSTLICHDHEAAAAAILARTRQPDTRIVVWLHSLYDTPHPSELPTALRELLPPDSILAGALAIADTIVTSAGILADARELDWPPRMRATQAALLRATERGDVCLVEADQCLPRAPLRVPATTPDRPRFVFAARPGVHKGAGIFLAIVERLAALDMLDMLDIDFVALGDPQLAGLDPRDPTVSRIRWLPWLAPEQFWSLLRSSTCTLLPSLSEGFGLVAAEADALGVPLLYNDVGGLRSLPTSARATPIGLRSDERASLYRLWGELIGTDTPTAWARWHAARPNLDPLIERWIDRVRSLAIDGPPPPTTNASPPARPSWAEALLSALDR